MSNNPQITSEVEKAFREMLASIFEDLPDTKFTGRDVAYLIRNNLKRDKNEQN
jgi:hypothetical protein